MPQTIHQRRQLHLVATAPTPEQRAALARDFDKRHPHTAAARIEAQLETDAMLARVRAAGEVGCADTAERPLTLREVARINAVGFLAIAGMLAVGWFTAPYVARALASLWVL